MDTARKCILLAAVGLTACGSTSRPKVHVAAGACPTPDAEALAKAADEKRFELGRPELPEYLDCLRWPMTALRTISSGFMDPDHGYTPGRHDGTDLPAPVGTD